MNTLRKELRPDFATAEKLYPLILKRLEDYEAFHDAQSEDTPEEVLTKNTRRWSNTSVSLRAKTFPIFGYGNGGKAMVLKLLLLIWHALPCKAQRPHPWRRSLLFVRIVIDNEFECENDFQRMFMPYIFYSRWLLLWVLEINCPRFDPSAFNTIKIKMVSITNLLWRR